MSRSDADTLAGRWANWDRTRGPKPFARDEVDQALFGLDKQSLLLLRGCRGVGKTVALRLMAAKLAQRGWSRDSMIYVDLEDPVLAPWSDLERLWSLVNSYSKPRVVFLDGVERLPSWADFARDLRAKKGLNVVAAATSSLDTQIPAGFAHVNILPLDLSNWLRFSTGMQVDISSAERMWKSYLSAGGLPLPEREEGHQKALLELFFASLMQDVILLQPIRDTNVLTALSVYLVSRSGELVSASRLKGRMTKSVDQARMFLSHLQKAGLISLVSRVEDSGRKANQAARLLFASDTGLAQVLGTEKHLKDDQPIPGPSGMGLTAVFHQLKRMGKTLYSWKKNGRTGLLVGEASSPEVVIDVQLDQDLDVGLGPLAAAMDSLGCASGLLLTSEPGDEGSALAGSGAIESLPIWKWLLEPNLGSMSEKTDIQVKKVSPGLPKHLL